MEQVVSAYSGSLRIPVSRSYCEKQEQINKTPTWFVNGYELPEAYRIDDLMGMVPGLAENYSSVIKKERSSTEIL